MNNSLKSRHGKIKSIIGKIAPQKRNVGLTTNSVPKNGITSFLAGNNHL